MHSKYTHKSLAQKLSLRNYHHLSILHAPKNYFHILGDSLNNLPMSTRLEPGSDFIHLFAQNTKQLRDTFPELVSALAKNGALWISWLKNKQSDLDENIIREIGLHNGVVDIKVISIDESWSGLSFVYRLKDRKS